jgi:hypothetical protein
MEQPPDQRRFAVIHTSGRGESQKFGVEILLEKFGKIWTRQIVREREH